MKERARGGGRERLETKRDRERMIERESERRGGGEREKREERQREKIFYSWWWWLFPRVQVFWENV